MTRRTSYFAIVALPVLAVACTDGNVSSPTAVPSASMASSRQGFAPPHSVDAFFEGVATRVPGFGGMFFQNGEAVVWLIDPAAAPAARSELLPVLMARGLGQSAFTFRQGKYHWRQLSEWQHKSLLQVLAMDGVVFTDSDETINRIIIGIESESYRSAVQDAVVKAGIPTDAVVVKVTTRPERALTLEDRHRPALGGLRITSSTGGCTLGFNVDYSGTRTFMTNSHCTDAWWRSTGQAFYQSSFNVSDHFVGNEYIDPALRNFGTFCPSGRNDCRWSDAALIQYAASTDQVLGRVARTASAHRWDGSKAIAGRFWISGKETNFAGQTLHKMGATTGWTYGGVDQTCVHYDMGTYYLMCQGTVHAGVWDGDSGSPVFLTMGGDEVKLVGILWGGHPKGRAEGARFIFSPIGGVEEDFNTALSVVGTAPVAVFVDGPTSVLQEGTYSYEAFPSGGSGSYTYRWEVRYVSFSGGNWGELGTNKVQTITILRGDGDIELRVTVTSAGESAQSTVYISNHISGLP